MRRLTQEPVLVEPAGFVPSGCRDCRNRDPLQIPITMAFQRLVDVRARRVRP